MRILIIGYGNTLRGDDAFGRVIAERWLREFGDPEVEALSLHQLAPELMEALSEADFAVFLDAAAWGEPGVLVERRVAPRAPDAASFTHFASPEGLLSGAKALYGRAAEGVMLSLAAEDFSLGAGLSAAVAARVDEVFERVRALVEGRLGRPGLRSG